MDETSRLLLEKQRIRTDFDRAASRYNQYADLQRAVAGQLCAFAREVIPTGALVADGGCGTGFVADHTARMGRPWDLIQLDVSESMCCKARECDMFSPVLVADLEALPFANNSLQGFVSSLTFQWIENLPKALAELYRVLQPEATFMIATLGPNTLRELRDSFNKADPEGPPRVNIFPTLERLRVEVHKCGFDYLFSHQEDRVMYYQNAYDVMHHTRGIGAGNKFTERSRTLSARSLFDRVADYYGRSYGREEGVPVTWEVFYLSARKL